MEVVQSKPLEPAIRALSAMAFALNRAPDRNSRSSCPQLIVPPERGDHLLAHLVAFTSARGNLQIPGSGCGTALFKLRTRTFTFFKGLPAVLPHEVLKIGQT